MPFAWMVPDQPALAHLVQACLRAQLHLQPCLYLLSRGLDHLQDRDRFRKYHLAAYTLTRQECHLILNGEEFLQRLERESNPVNDLIALPDVTEDDRELTSGVCGEGTCLVRHIGHLDNRSTEQRLAELVTEYGPQGPRRGVSEQPTYTNRGVGHQPCARGAIS